MKKLILLFTVLFSFTMFSQETKIKEYSFTQFFDMIKAEQDTVFKLENALIKYNTKTDERFSLTNKMEKQIIKRDSIFINKHLKLNNVHFVQKFQINNTYKKAGVFNYISFRKPIELEETSAIIFQFCSFKETVKFRTTEKSNNVTTLANPFITFIQNSFEDEFSFDLIGTQNNPNQSIVFIEKNIFKSSFTKKKIKKGDFTFIDKGISVWVNNARHLSFSKNSINNYQYVSLTSSSVEQTDINSNTFNNISPEIYLDGISKTEYYELDKNVFNNFVLLEIQGLKNNFIIDWPSIKGKSIAKLGYWDFKKLNNTNSTELLTKYFNKAKFENKTSFKEELVLKGIIHKHFKERMDGEFANEVYVDIKDLETQRFEFLQSKSPSFENYFTLKINQFLKVFSAYGTKPAKAVVFSMYVILLFAFIYLLFPNSWDAHGRKRIMNRYAFFFKYMNKKSGIHEVYLDNQKEELLEFDEFKDLVAQQGKTVPKFFTATALPLYKWAISSTKFSASVLKRVDIMKGTWSEVPKSKRIWKSILLIGAFTLAICYDILIKMLNAIMLSINTFTTLGFGEIPIKGLPRYLAIIQGFIGWFMLTIFSVSLISQLLN